MPYLETRIRHLHSAAKQGDRESQLQDLTVALQPPPADKLRALDHGADKYTYKFTPAPAQYDLVIRQIRVIIRELNRKDITFANLHVRVHPTTSASPFWPLDLVKPYYDAKVYTFMDDYTEFPPTGMVFVSSYTGELTSDTVFIKYGKEWMLLRKWLEWRVRPGRHELVGERGYKAQQKQWKLNGKEFHLMDLP